MKTLLMLVLVTSFNVFADEKMDPKQAEMMKKFEDFAKPGEAHKLLSGMEGKWSYTQKWWESKDAKPQESTGTSTMKMILGGRYLEQEFKGTAMGMPFQGKGITGYDNVLKTYRSTWVDTMGTGIMMANGSFDPATKTITETGEYTCPVQADQKAEYRAEWKLVDAKNMTYSMFGKGMTGEGDEFKMMEINYKKK